jgi:hypothetical protein
VWFAQPAKALADPVRLLAYVTTLGRREDIQTLRRHLGDDDLHEAPGMPRPGIFDGSWCLLAPHTRPLTAIVPERTLP